MHLLALISHLYLSFWVLVSFYIIDLMNVGILGIILDYSDEFSEQLLEIVE